MRVTSFVVQLHERDERALLSGTTKTSMRSRGNSHPGLPLFFQFGCPVDDEGDGFEGAVTDRVHQEALAVGGDVVVGA